jgi:hypothetical protein
MDTPLMGSPRANYRFFYTAGGGVLFSLILLIIITSYSASIIGDVNKLMQEMHIVMDGIKELLPEAEFGADLMKAFCLDGNFSKLPNTGDICHNKGIIPKTWTNPPTF